MRRTSLAHRFQASPNFEPRLGAGPPDLLILHYTGMKSAEAAVDWLCNPQSGVSCHYLIDAAGAITQMVDEEMRAWHAGVSSWRGADDINSRSIGIEIHNPGHDLGYEDFPPRQIESVVALCRDIATRHGLRPDGILAHSDVAPLRKKDPGEKFPWKQLYEEGVGHWVAPAPIVEAQVVKLGDEGDAVTRLRQQLAGYGYGIEAGASFDSTTQAVVTAFQRHFRPERVDGMADASTIDTLQRLLASLPLSN